MAKNRRYLSFELLEQVPVEQIRDDIVALYRETDAGDFMRFIIEQMLLYCESVGRENVPPPLEYSLAAVTGIYYIYYGEGSV